MRSLRAGDPAHARRKKIEVPVKKLLAGTAPTSLDRDALDWSVERARVFRTERFPREVRSIAVSEHIVLFRLKNGVTDADVDGLTDALNAGGPGTHISGAGEQTTHAGL